MARFLEPPYLHTTERGAAPFRIWAVDTVVKLTPAAPDGAQDVIVGVDPFTRWVEIGKLPHLTSHETAVWFHEAIVCRYGMPALVRTDRGPEYRGAFDRYLRENGVAHRLISTSHPRANGLVERQNRVVKATLRKFLAHCPGGRWWEVLGDVARAIRTLPTRTTKVSPYLLVFK